MTAGNDRPPISPLLVLTAGLLGVIHDSWAGSAAASSLHCHALFGAVLCGSVMTRLYSGARRPLRGPAIDIHMLSRRLSRQVYLVLYVLMFVSMTIDILRGEPHGSMLRAAEGFRSYLGCGGVALITIHILAVPFKGARSAAVR